MTEHRIPPATINKAKAFSCVDILDYFGHAPVIEKRNGELIYYSPFRNEKTPSFYCNPKVNGFQDFGDPDKKGDAISLYRFLTGKGFLTAVHDLSENKINVSETKNVIYVPLKVKESGTEIIAIRDEICKPALILFAENRGISLDTLNRFCLEIQYLQINTGKVYTSIGFRNDKDGFSLRSAGFKSVHGNNAISTLKGNKEVLVFEGFFSFLSFFEMHKRLQGRTVIVLNGLANLKQIKWKEYEKVFLFLDNDNAGKKATKRVNLLHNNVEDWSDKLYFGYNDLNERLLATLENQGLQ